MMKELFRLARERDEKLMILAGICRASVFRREMAFRWYGIDGEYRVTRENFCKN